MVDEIVKITLGYIDYLVPEPKWIVEFEKIIKLNLKEETKEIEKVNFVYKMNSFHKPFFLPFSNSIHLFYRLSNLYNE